MGLCSHKYESMCSAGYGWRPAQGAALGKSTRMVVFQCRICGLIRVVVSYARGSTEAEVLGLLGCPPGDPGE